MFAYWDDIYTVSSPTRVDRLHAVIEELWARARIHLNHSKTQVWNRGGTEPSGVEALTRAARVLLPGAVVWRGYPILPPVQQGVEGSRGAHRPRGFRSAFLGLQTAEQQVFFERIHVRSHEGQLLAACSQTSGH